MSSCRATSFYVAPGKKLSFVESTLATREDGKFVEFHHRKDLERYEREHPEWDKVCYVGPAGGAEALARVLVVSPERVARWKIDSRIVNGRAPAGPVHTLYNLSTGGIKKAGGVAAVVGLFSGASRPLAQAVAEAAQRGDGFSLSLALGLRSVVGDDKAAEISRGDARWRHLGFAPADPELVASAYEMLVARYGAVRAAKLLGQLSSAVPERWEDLAYQSSGTPPEALAALLGGADDISKKISTGLAWINPEVLDTLSFDPEERVRSRVAGHELASTDTVRRLSSDESSAVRGAVALRKDVAEEILVALAQDRDSVVRAAAARNPRTPPEVLAVLAEEEVIANTVAHNPSASAETLASLYGWRLHTFGGDGALQRRVLENPGVPEWVLENGARSRDKSLAAAVARNSVVSAELQRYLYSRDDAMIDLALVDNPLCSPEILDRIRERCGGQTMAAIARNPNAGVATLERLAKSPDPDVRAAVSRSKNVTMHALEVIMETAHDNYTAKLVAHSTACTEELLTAFSRGSIGQRVAAAAATKDVSLLRKLSTDRSPDVRCSVGRRNIIDHDTQVTLAEDGESLVRETVANNDSIDADVAARLTRDVDDWVVRLARHNAALRPADRARALAESDDPDDAFWVAELLGANRVEGLGAVIHPGWAHLEQVMGVALRESEDPTGIRVTWPEKPASVLALPGVDSLPWRIDERVDLIEGSEVLEGLRAKVLRSKHALKVNANYMGNCTEGYSDRVAEGSSVILALVDEEGATRYNAELVINGDKVLIGEVNSRHNGGNVPVELREKLATMATAVGASH